VILKTGSWREMDYGKIKKAINMWGSGKIAKPMAMEST